ncbi:hypothetical protein [Asaia sp. HN010]|uniref:hypothetical protein n=1 Tax=Asaia sp. HN010 TaxID=3081233 RepID=UPI003019B580
MDDQPQFADTLEDQEDNKSSDVVLAALAEAQRAFRPWQDNCDRIDKKWSLSRNIANASDWSDAEFDIFWASTEILKPAIYSRPPVPVVATRFSIRDPFTDQISDMLERTLMTTLDLSDIDDVMRHLRDDLVMAARGVPWVTYDEDAERACVEHLDRTDFLHEPARKWAEVGWVARCGWMTRKQMRDRFQSHSGQAYMQATLQMRRDKDRDGMTDGSEKAAVWEVWHRIDRRVYWVSEGVDVLLDESEPYLDLSRFFPCTKPVYGSLKRRTLIPIPDYGRFEKHLDQINELTSRIYALLDQVRIKGLIPGGGDVAEAVESALAQNDSDTIYISVPGAAFSASGGNFVQYLPLDMIATTISGLIQSRSQLIQDYYQLSGISDIMRGATDAQETLGAQQLKSQYGSIRVRDKVDALTDCARDICQILGEVIASNYSGKKIMEMSMTHLPTDTDIKKQIRDIESKAKAALEEIEEHAREMQAQVRVQGALQPPAQMGAEP